jgi:hypothetical protein
MPTRRSRRHLAGAALALLALGACVPRAAPPAPLPAPALVPRVVPVPAPSPAPPPVDWETGPASPGDWRFTPADGASTATFRSDSIGLAIICERHREIAVHLLGAQGRALVIRTSYGVRRFPVESGELATMGFSLPLSDPLLDQIAFSRGRFQVAIDGGPSLVVPAWPEFARVVEDCRGQ